MQTGSRVRQGRTSPPGPLLESRFAPPPLRPGLVPRTSLLGRLSASEAPLVVLGAGAGYGKTTFLVQLTRAEARPTVWLSLDETDNDPLVLLSYLAAGLALAVPVESRVFNALSGRSSARVPTEALRYVAAAFSNAPAPFVFVLDDVHMVTDPAAVDVLGTVIREVPAGSRFVLAGRSLPSLPLARQRSQGRLLEIGPQELAMGADEAAALLRGAGVSLTDDEVIHLADRTEGWPAALYLAALAIASGEDRHQVMSFSGRDRSIADYLHAELVRHLDADDAAFLTDCAILERLSGQLCDAVLERADSASRLASLAETNLFVVPLDHQGHWYRCHQLFRELLLQDLAEQGPGRTAALHRRATAWLESHGDIDAAIEHAHRAGDVDTAARLVGANAQPAMTQGRDATVRRWLGRFDDAAMLRWPTIAIAGTWVFALRGDSAKAARFADLAEVGDEASVSLDGSASIASARAMLRSAMCRHGVEAMANDAALACELEPESSTWRPLAVTLLGVAALLGDDAHAAETLFAEATDMVGPSRGNPAVTVAWAERAALSRARGDLREAARSIERAEEIIAAKGLEEYATTALTSAVGARVALEAGDLDHARRALASVQRLRPYLSNALPWLAIHSRLEAAHALLGLAEAAGAHTLLIEIDAVLRTNPQMGTLIEQIDELRAQVRAQPVGGRGASTLTSAELRLLPLLPTHLSFPEIGERLFISRSTVKTQAISIYRKLGVSSRGAAVEQAREVGLLPR